MGSIIQEHIKILNVYVPKNKSSKYVNQKLIKLHREIDKYIIVGNLSTFYQN